MDKHLFATEDIFFNVSMDMIYAFDLNVSKPYLAVIYARVDLQSRVYPCGDLLQCYLPNSTKS